MIGCANFFIDMKNITDSTKISTLAVKSVYNLNTGFIVCDLSPSQWIGNGNQSVVSATIEVLDKDSNIIGSGTVYPPMTANVSVSIPKQNGIYKWGTYIVTVVLNDGSNSYSDSIPFVLSAPEKVNKNTGVIALNIKPNKPLGKMSIYSSVPPPYKEVSVSTYTEQGVFYYPNGSTESDVPFTFTPFELKLVFGRSEVKIQTIATYQFDNNVYAVVVYNGDESKDIKASVDLCLAWAVVQDLIFKRSVSCDSKESTELFGKIDDAIRLMTLIATGQSCGYDTDDIEQELESVLGVGITCNTLEDLPSETVPSESILIEGCGVFMEKSGLTTKYKIDNYTYTVKVTNGGSAVTQTDTINGCNKITQLTFNWGAISDIVLTQFEGAKNARVINIFNTALNQVIVPTCIDTQPSWNSKSLKEKFQKIFDKQCDCCSGSAPDPNFTMELQCSSATYGGSFVAGTILTGQQVNVPITVSGTASVSATVSGNGFSGTMIATDVNQSTTSLTIPLNYDGSGNAGLKNVTVTITSPAGVQTCIIPIVVSQAVSCTAPISLSVSNSGPVVTVSFYPASNPPVSYEVKRRHYSDPDVDASYVTLPAPTYNSGLGKYTTSETYGSTDNNKIWVYKAVSICGAENNPFITTRSALQVCPTVSLVAGVDSVAYTFSNVGGDTNRYRIGIYNGSTLIGSIQNITPPFSNPIFGTISGLPTCTSLVFRVLADIIDGDSVFSITCNTGFTTECEQSDNVIVINDVPAAYSTVNIVDVAVDGNAIFQFSGNNLVPPESSINGNHSGFNGSVTFSLFPTNFDGELIARLFKNGINLQSMPIDSTNPLPIVFGPENFLPTDELRVILEPA